MGPRKAKEKETIMITAPNLPHATFRIRGISPYVQCRFSEKSMEMMKATQEAGSVAKKGKKKEKKNFDECYHQAMYIGTKGGHGINSMSFKNAMVSACRLVGFQMTRAKLAIFIEPDDYDKKDATPLVTITKGKPMKHEGHVRLANGSADIRIRPMWHPGWEADVTVTWDADVMSKEDIANLLNRAGLQVGVGEGRPDSKQSCGMGWGQFTLVGKE